MKFHHYPLIFTSILTLAACGGPDAEEHLSRAQQYLDADDEKAAILELKNAVQQDENLTEARLLLADTYWSMGRYLDAEKEYNKAAAAAPLTGDRLAQYGHTLYALEKYDALLELNPTNRDTGQKNAALLAIQAAGALRKNDNENALSLIAQSEQAGISPWTNYAKALVAFNDAQPTEAIALLENAIEMDDRVGEFYIIKGHIARTQGNYPLAIESFQQLAALHNNNQVSQLLLAEVYVLNGDFDKAKPIVKQLLSVADNHPLLNALQAQIEFHDDNMKEAVRFADASINNNGRFFSNYAIVAIDAFHNKDFRYTVELLTPFKSVIKPNTPIFKTYLAALIASGENQQALSLLDQTNQEQIEPELLSDAAMLLAGQGETESALSLSQRAAEVGDTQANLRLGLLQLNSNNAEGVSTVESILEAEPDNEAGYYLLFVNYLRTGETQAAEDVVKRWLTQLPDSVRGKMAQGYIYQQNGDLRQAKQVFSDVAKMPEYHFQATLLLTNLALTRNDNKEAYRLSTELVSTEPNSPIALELLVRTAVVTEQTAAAEGLLTKHLPNAKNNQVFLALASLYLQTGKPQEAINILSRAPYDDGRGHIHQLLGRLYVVKRDLPQAIRELEKSVALQPNNQASHLLLIDALISNQQTEKALSSVLNAKQIFPNHDMLNLQQARIYLATDTPNQALKTLDSLSDEAKAGAAYLSLRATAFGQLGKFDDAAELLQQKYDSQPSVANLIELLKVEAKISGNQAIVARAEAERANVDAQEEVPLNLFIAELLIDDKPGEAIALYQDALSKQPSNVVALNNLSWLLMEQSEFESACRYAERAFSLISFYSEIQDTYGYCLLKTGNLEEGLRLLKSAHEGNDKSAEIAMHYAEALATNGNKLAALQVLSSIETPDEEESDKIRQLEEQISQM
uniref:XrtA/PEP-CTERM system TPR-repeat protein PrsT n=1 Tax=Thaumasiovibrio occultus TaxID=1891184 RepID=UPI000B353A18|nr:XrtA/PEP-CTERM system TPR-repeat protein PrsT [Thaumasiovibrio occultus]